MTAAVETAGEFSPIVIADGYKSGVDVPQLSRRIQLAHDNIIGKGVTRGGVDQHQLQLVRVGDGGRILGTQERAGVTVVGANPPVGGEVPTGETRLLHHIGGGQAGSAGAGSGATTSGYARGFRVPETFRERASVV